MTSAWQQLIRQQVLERDDFICQTKPLLAKITLNKVALGRGGAAQPNARSDHGEWSGVERNGEIATLTKPVLGKMTLKELALDRLVLQQKYTDMVTREGPIGMPIQMGKKKVIIIPRVS